MDIVLQGLVFGVANGLLAAGIVLVYMSNRAINVAQGELGAFAVAVMFALSNRADFPYPAALACALLATAALGALIETTVIRRLFTSPRLIVLIATIGVAQVITAARAGIPKPRNRAGEDVVFGGASTFPVPFEIEPISFGRVVFHSAELLVLTVGPFMALALFAFLRWSPYGIALRAAAENAQRARLLGIPVRRVSTLAWVLAALLSAVAAILLAPVIGYSSDAAVGLSLLFRGLAAATIAGLTSVGTAFGVGLALGVADQLIFVWSGQAGLTDVVLLIAVMLALLVRRDVLRTATSAAESAPDTGEPIRPLPERIRSDPRWSNAVFVTRLVGVGAVVLMPFVLSSANTYFLGTTVLLCTAVVSTTVLTGWAGQLSLGQWAVAGVGGLLGMQLYTDLGVPFPLAFVGALVLGGLLAAVIGLPALRLHGVNVAVVTLAFAVTASSWLFNRDWVRPDQDLQLPTYMSTRVQYAVAFLLLGLVLVLARTMDRTQLGRAIRAVRDNPVQASSMGISVVRTKLAAFAISGAIASAAGFLYIDALGVGNSAGFPTAQSLALLAAAVIGGLGSLTGAVVGGFYIFAVQYFAAQWFPEHAAVISLLSTGAGLLVLVIYLPGGLIRPMVAGRDLLARWLTGIDAREAVAVRPAEHELEGAAAGLAAGRAGVSA